MSESEIPELEFDWGSKGRSTQKWELYEDAILNSTEGLEYLRKFVKRFKRKGGYNGKPGDIDELISELVDVLGYEDEYEEPLRELLEGEDDDTAELSIALS